jgi:septal ring factor EnvC (AmiA/AmiB activator)
MSAVYPEQNPAVFALPEWSDTRLLRLFGAVTEQQKQLTQNLFETQQRLHTLMCSIQAYRAQVSALTLRLYQHADLVRLFPDDPEPVCIGATRTQRSSEPPDAASLTAN